MTRLWTAIGMLLAVGAAQALLSFEAPVARAATVMVIEDFAPMRMVPSSRAPRKAYAPLGLLLETRRSSRDGRMFEATNGEEQPFESPAWLHYWMFPSSVLAEPGETRVELDLLLLDRDGALAPGGTAPFSGRRFSVAEFLADSAALPESFHVAAGDPGDRSPWGGRAIIPAPPGAPYQTPANPSRLELLRAAKEYRLAVTLSSEKTIARVQERVAAARVLVKVPRCKEFDYVETEVLTVVERKRTIGEMGGTALVPIPEEDLTTTSSAAGVLWTRIVYVADVHFEDGTSETVARRLLVTWPLCPEEAR
ncbi:MAG TPA: hypothetical protein VFT32_02720 [Candidatus Eisenbacteria bacterium]|nr:hypothetical protein [Candidatus Eisenbacteria bacterium]